MHKQTLAPPIRVIIADDHARSRRGLRALLATFPQLEIIGEAKDGQEAIYLVDSLQPDVILIDARMPVMDGLETTQYIKQEWPQIKVIVLSLDATYQTAALAAHADAFMIKGGPLENLWSTILVE